MATLLADSPPAPSDEPKAPDAVAGAPQAPVNGAAPAPAGAPVVPAASTPVAHPCARCGATMAPRQDWCLQCGAGAPGSIGSPSWRSAATILTATIALALGAVAAAYAALSEHAPPTHVVRTTVAQATTPTVTVPPQTTPTNPFGTTPITPVLPKNKFKPPTIPLNVPKVRRNPSNGLLNNGGVKSKSKPTNTVKTTTGGGNEPKPIAVVLDTNAAATYNPYNYAASGFGDPSLTIDGDTSTAWIAQVDPTTAPKMAEGVLIDMKAQQKLSALALITSTPGITVQVYGAQGQTAPTSITDTAWVSLSHSRVVKKKHARITLKEPKKAFNFIALWISQAPASSTAQAPGRVSVNELELFPAE